VSAFKDHFSDASQAYAAHRPTYPPALAEWLAEISPARDRALDCGCGTGQLSVLLASHFARVVATDASAGQIAEATPHEAVEYRVAPAEASGLDPATCDLVVAAQAAHWFDMDAFNAEARRVAKPGGVIALVTYGIMTGGEAIDAVIQPYYRTTVGAYWPPERRHVEDGYRALPFPFPEIATPPLAIAVSWTLHDLVGYVETWSATKAARKALGFDPVAALRDDLAGVWGDAKRRHPIRFPLSVRAGRVT
jgi:SAM-dependent methyltransferase